MSMPHKTQWIADHNRALDDYESGDEGRDVTALRLKELGFSLDEINHQLESVETKVFYDPDIFERIVTRYEALGYQRYEAERLANAEISDENPR